MDETYPVHLDARRKMEREGTQSFIAGSGAG